MQDKDTLTWQKRLPVGAQLGARCLQAQGALQCCLVLHLGWGKEPARQWDPCVPRALCPRLSPVCVNEAAWGNLRTEDSEQWRSSILFPPLRKPETKIQIPVYCPESKL